MPNRKDFQAGMINCSTKKRIHTFLKKYLMLEELDTVTLIYSNTMCADFNSMFKQREK